jgi:hypothetical protein
VLATADTERTRLVVVFDAEVHETSGETSAIEDFVLSYLQEKVPNLPKNILNIDSYDHESGLLSTERIRTDAFHIWSSRLMEPDASVPGRSWSVELSIGDIRGNSVFGSRVNCFSRHLDFVYEPAVPRVYRDVVSRGVLHGDGIRLSRNPFDITSDEDVEWLVALIKNPRRRRNIIGPF